MKQLNKKGMTLLEVIISLVLFTFMAISLTQLTQGAIKYKERVTRNIKITKFSRNVLRIIRKDIRNIFYTQDMNGVAHISFRKENPLRLERHSEQDTFNQRERGAKKERLIEFELSHVEPYMLKTSALSGGITGKKDSLRISSLSYTRNRENEKTSDQNLIMYYLKPCKNRKKPLEKSSCLWRKFSTMTNQGLADLKNYDEFVLLEKVKKFQLSYYNMYSNEWKPEWKTSPNDTNILPASIRITLEFENKKKQIVKQELNLPLHQQILIPTPQ